MTVATGGRTEGETALDVVVKLLEDRIVEGYAAGGQLPAEGQLAAECGVSRLTVREALKVLAGRGLVELSRGRRPTVREPDSTVLSGYLTVAIRRDPRTLLELTEIRKSLEILSATLAARNVSRASVAAIEAAYDAMVAASAALDETPDDARAIEAFHEADIALHEALALASGNRLLALLIEGMEEALRRSFHRSFEGRLTRGESVASGLATHREILDRVRDGDARAAAAAMRHCLEETERDLRAAVRGAEGR